MAKDKRVKGCPNENCERHEKKYKYKATDRYCTICGEPLILVCERCHCEIGDEGIDHKMCARCEAILADRKEQVVKNVKGVAKGAAMVVPVAAGKLKGVDPKNLKAVGKAAAGAAAEIAKKIK